MRAKSGLDVDHGVKLHDIPDEYLVDTLVVAKKVAVASGFVDYNILQVRLFLLGGCCICCVAHDWGFFLWCGAE